MTNENIWTLFEELLAANVDVLRRLKDDETQYTAETFRQQWLKTKTNNNIMHL